MALPILPIVLSAIPSIVKLFDEDDRKEGVKELTGDVISQASQLLGIPQANNKDELIAHLNANPDEVIKLKQLEQNVEQKLIEFL